MSYDIRRTNGDELIAGGLPENVVNVDTTPVALIGKLTANYGVYQSNNFVHLLEHFANKTPPSNAINGTIWFNTTDNTVYICIDEIAENFEDKWRKFAFINKDKPTNPATGDLFYDTSKHKFYVYDDTLEENDKWVCIGPIDVGSVIEGTDETTSSSSGISYLNIPVQTDTTCNIEIKLVGREIIPSEYIGLREPEVGTWNIDCLISSYTIESGGISSNVLSLINEPFVQKIGSTDYADGWEISLEPNTNTETLQIKLNASGIPFNGVGGSINWKLYYKIIKVV